MTIAYQYVTLRAVPDAVREEFANVGVVIYAQQADFLQVAADVAASRLAALAPGVDTAELEQLLDTMTQVCSGSQVPGLPQMAKQGQRFGWLSAPRSSLLRPGPVHSGRTPDPAAELQRLLRRLVQS